MKIKSGFLLREIAGSYVVVTVGSRAAEFNSMITMNDTAAFLWKQLEQGATEDELVAALLAHYDGVDEAAARKDVESILARLRQVNCLE